MKKAIGQTVRDLKREVNKKVLKVPSIEQKVLDATSNEPWGPHGSLLADIAQATRNYHEYQMIMSVIWKRTNDTGKNWRHVYKALTVLEYLVAHGSERVIDDIREHAYQISTLSDFQYIDSSGKDQGNNVRKKSQSLVVLVNDKERIQEVRQKAASNREKYRNTPAGGMYRPGSNSGGYGDRYDDDRYESRNGNRDDDRNGYGRERDPRDDDRYGRYGDTYGREGDRNSRDDEDRYGRDGGYRDDEYRGRSQSVDDYQYGSRSRSADRDRSRANEDDGQYSNRGSGAKADDHSQDGSSTGKSLDRKYSGQSFGAPPTYEDAVGAARSPSYSERDGESSLANAPKASSPTGASPSHAATTSVHPPAPASPPAPAPAESTAEHSNKEVEGFDEFDPRGSFSAVPTTTNVAAPVTSAAEMDFLGSLSESYSSNSLALMPVSQPATTSEANASGILDSGPTASQASTINNQPFDDPFGDGPFQAVPSTESASIQQPITASIQQPITASNNSFNTNSTQGFDVPQPGAQKAASEFGGNFYDPTYMPSGPSAVQPPTNTQFVQQELSIPNHNHDFDILADILPPSAPSSFVNGQPGYPIPSNQSQTSYPLQSAESVSQTGYVAQPMALTYPVQSGPPSQMNFHSQSGGSAHANLPNPNYYGGYNSQPVSTGPTGGYMVPPSSTGPTTTQHNFLSQPNSAPIPSQMGPPAPQVQPSSYIAQVSVNNPSSIGSSSAVVPLPSKDKFETKSTVWADTLSRGLVNLNISGPKTNPLSDIGVDFDAINRKEKRMEKPTTAPVTSTVTMGKAMGSGSGIGRAGAGAIRTPPPNPMMGSGMNMGMNGGPGAGMGMGGYGVNQPTGRGMGMGMGMINMPGNMGMGMPGNMGMGMPGNMGIGMPGNMGMGQGMNMGMGMGQGMNMGMGMGQSMNMQQQMGVPPGSAAPGGGYNNMMGTGSYGGQQPYGGGGGYR